MVYAKRPFGGPEQVLAYLGRYTHRVAIANSRLVDLADGKVSFRWKDYRHEGRNKVMTLDAGEFMRRFLLHVLPSGFHRIRHFGFLANGQRTARLALCRRLLADDPPTPLSAAQTKPPAPPPRQPVDRDRPEACPCCGGVMRILVALPRSPPDPSRGRR